MAATCGDAITVAVRVRPFSRREVDIGARRVVKVTNASVEVTPPAGHPHGAPKKWDYDYAFDACDSSGTELDPDEDQKRVYNAIGRPLVAHAFDGFNATLFAYGQTGSGKTHTMFGREGCLGVTPRLCHQIFESKAKLEDVECDVELSFLELYNEVPHDLLSSTRKLDVREHPITGPYVQNLSRFLVNDAEDVLNLLRAGMQTRSVAATLMNHESSRSHALCIVHITMRRRLECDEPSDGDGGERDVERRAQLTLVDLAGSERATKTGASGQRLQEGANINRSLTTLGMVIRHLSQRLPGKPPYRSSKLTFLLSQALGGNSKTNMLATISPHADNTDETVSTCRYASDAKKVVTHAVVNEDPRMRLIKSLQEEVAQLRAQLTAYEQGEGPLTVRGEPSRRAELHERLGSAFSALDEVSMSREQKMEMREALNREHAESLRSLGVPLARLRPTVPHLTSLRDDSAQLCYELHDGQSLLGSGEHCDVRLCGSNILARHCVITVIDAASGNVTIAPAPQDDQCEQRPPGELTPSVPCSPGSASLTPQSQSPRSAAGRGQQEGVPRTAVPRLTLPSSVFRPRGGSNPSPVAGTPVSACAIPAPVPVTYVNGTLLTEEQELADRDRVLVGNHVFRFDNPAVRGGPADGAAAEPESVIDFNFAVDEYRRQLESMKTARTARGPRADDESSAGGRQYSRRSSHSSSDPGRSPHRSPPRDATPQPSAASPVLYAELAEGFRAAAGAHLDVPAAVEGVRRRSRAITAEQLVARIRRKAQRGDGDITVEAVSENERWYPIVGFRKPIKGRDPPHWSDVTLKHNVHSLGHVESLIERYGDGKWRWVEPEWRLENWDGDGKGGWQYAERWDGKFADRKHASGNAVRRRVWSRTRVRQSADGTDPLLAVGGDSDEEGTSSPAGSASPGSAGAAGAAGVSPAGARGPERALAELLAAEAKEREHVGNIERSVRISLRTVCTEECSELDSQLEGSWIPRKRSSLQSSTPPDRSLAPALAPAGTGPLPSPAAPAAAPPPAPAPLPPGAPAPAAAAHADPAADRDRACRRAPPPRHAVGGSSGRRPSAPAPLPAAAPPAAAAPAQGQTPESGDWCPATSAPHTPAETDGSACEAMSWQCAGSDPASSVRHRGAAGGTLPVISLDGSHALGRAGSGTDPMQAAPQPPANDSLRSSNAPPPQQPANTSLRSSNAAGQPAANASLQDAWDDL